MRLKDKVAIITGGGSGFGEGMARRFAAEGAKVVVNDINAANGERVANAVKQHGGQAMFVKADIAKAGDADTERLFGFHSAALAGPATLPLRCRNFRMLRAA